jgi:multidrug efflux pump subunit AcrA (membrane-fusion protein)
VPAVPKAAVTERDGAKVVFVVREGRARRVAVEGGRALADFVEVRGLAPGERVIVKPAERIADGARVEAAAK